MQGSVEAVANALTNLSTDAVGVNVISAGVGGITESDVTLAKASSAIIIGFNVRPAGKSQQLAEQEGVDIKLYQVIYDAIDDVKKAMVGMLAPVLREKVAGQGRGAPGLHHPQGGHHRRRVRHRGQDHAQGAGAPDPRLGRGLHRARSGRCGVSRTTPARSRRATSAASASRATATSRRATSSRPSRSSRSRRRWRTRPAPAAAADGAEPGRDGGDCAADALHRRQPFAEGEANGAAAGQGSGATEVQRLDRRGGRERRLAARGAGRSRWSATTGASSRPRWTRWWASCAARPTSPTTSGIYRPSTTASRWSAPIFATGTRGGSGRRGRPDVATDGADRRRGTRGGERGDRAPGDQGSAGAGRRPHHRHPRARHGRSAPGARPVHGARRGRGRARAGARGPGPRERLFPPRHRRPAADEGDPQPHLRDRPGLRAGRAGRGAAARDRRDPGAPAPDAAAADAAAPPQATPAEPEDE